MRRALSALVMLGTLMLYIGGASAGSGGAVGLGPVDIRNGVGPALTAVCTHLGMAPNPATCPNLDLNTGFFPPQIAEIAALTNANPGSVRSSLLWTNPHTNILPPDNTVSAVNRPELEPFDLSSLAFRAPTTLSRLTPIAFIADFHTPFGGMFAGATLLSDPAANSFFYAVTTGDGDQPETLDLFFDYLPQTRGTFSKDQDIGDIMLPLVRLDQDGIERPVTTTALVTMTTLNIRAACGGGPACLTATVSGDFSGTGTTEHEAAEVGIFFGTHYGPSPNSKIPHAIYEVRVPLLVRVENDPAYFGVKIQLGGSPFSAKVGSPTGINQISGLPTAFDHDVLGFTPRFSGKPVGIAPGAANYVAMFSNNGDGIKHQAVDTYLAIGTDGATVGHVLRFCAGLSTPPGFCGDTNP